MWKVRKDDELPAAPATPSSPSTTIPATQEIRPVETLRTTAGAMAHIGKSVVIKGQLSGSEDLFLDGEVEGSIDLNGHSLVVGSNGRVRAQVLAKEIVIQGKVDGNVHGERVELKKSALVVGDVITQRVVIEDGAFFKGSIDIQREAAKPEPARPAAATAAVVGAQPSLLDSKK